MSDTSLSQKTTTVDVCTGVDSTSFRVFKASNRCGGIS